MIDLFKIGFLEVNLLDLLDIFLVGLLIYQVYRLIKGSIAFNIFLGLLLVYLVWFIVRALEMELLSGILGQFIEVGVIMLLIVFQPEVRKFLLVLGKETRYGRKNVWSSLFSGKLKSDEIYAPLINEILSALVHFAKTKTGAIIVLTESSKLQFFAETGTELDSRVTSRLLESIFEKNSPLHDGAVIISDLRIVSAGSVLPLSVSEDLPSRIGMRHKATVGITEKSDAIAFAVSEERGEISYARNGRLYQDIKKEEVAKILNTFYQTHLQG